MWHWHAVVDVPATVEGPAAARRFVAAMLDGWGLRILTDDAQLVVSELVTNAYQHAPGTDSFELEIVRRGDGVRLLVTDGSAIRPVLGVPDPDGNPDRPGGRGVALVDHLAARWGAEDHQGGKRVWADLVVGQVRG